MDPIFSILIPVYNVENYLEQCFGSVLDQTFKDYEVIAVDDGSTDKSGDICNVYVRKYGNFNVIHKKNEGLISARRTAIAEAKGEYCVFLDSDDSLSENCLQKIYEYAKKYDSDTVIYTYYRFDEKGTSERIDGVFPSGRVFENDEKKELYKLMYSGGSINSIWTKAVKTSVLKADKTDYRVYYGRNMAEDVLQSLPILSLSKRIVYLNEPLYRYRYNTQSVSRSYSLDCAEKKNTLHVYYELKKYLEIWNCNDDDDKLRLDANHFNSVMYRLFKTYRYEKNKSAVLKYNWSQFLPSEPFVPFNENKYVNGKYLKVFQCIRDKRLLTAHFEITKKALYDKYRSLKKRINEKHG